ncbi:MAG: rhodanese-like domain-containing protein, partial [Nanoarchaeota archaeon]|nr:rhodanese-like domain-containing protein [Nanoarchaeota archaeon]
MAFKTISFYKYIAVDSPDELRDYCKATCEQLQLTGRILIAAEGINAAVSGKKENIEEFKKIILQNKLFHNLTFREQETVTKAHHKLVVRVRNEIVHFGEKVNVNKVGTPLSAVKLQQWYDDNQDFVIVDARNEYESKVGKFKNAVTLPIQNFREFPDAAQQLAQYKDKKMVLYCTGGIRCEKASAYLKQEGFEQVYQIEGGIINYVNQFPNSNWEGGLFVF